MIVLQQIVLVLNLLVAVVFGVAYFVVESPAAAPKTKARTGVLLASLFLAFLVLLALFSVLCAVLRHNPIFLALTVFVLVPFVIGRLVSYRTLRFYTALQILSLLLSAATLSAGRFHVQPKHDAVMRRGVLLPLSDRVAFQGGLCYNDRPCER